MFDAGQSVGLAKLSSSSVDDHATYAGVQITGLDSVQFMKIGLAMSRSLPSGWATSTRTQWRCPSRIESRGMVLSAASLPILESDAIFVAKEFLGVSGMVRDPLIPSRPRLTSL